MAAQTPSTVGGGDETPSKKLKTEWDDTRDTEPTKAQVEAESIKTTGQSEKFYSDMTQLLELTSTGSHLPPELQETLAQLVKTVGSSSDIPESAFSGSAVDLAGTGSAGGGGGAGGDEPKMEANDADFFSFLDFSTFQDGKPETPDLVPHSSTNPSPESGAGSEAEHPPPASGGSAAGAASSAQPPGGDSAKNGGGGETEPKVGVYDSDRDPLGLGIWDQIDGGEGAYYNTSDFLFDSSLPNSAAGENSWAIST